MPDLRGSIDLTRIFVDVGGDKATFIATDRIEAVLADRGPGARILSVSGKEYRTTLTPDEVIDRIGKWKP